MRRARRIADAQECQLYFDVTALLDDEWTGIAIVAAELAKELANQVARVHFFSERHLLAKSAVEAAIAIRGGASLKEDFRSGRAMQGMLPVADHSRPSIGIFPSVKSSRRTFTIEVNFIHDLSTLITPHFHNLDNIDYHMQCILADIDSSDLTVCPSMGTLTDLMCYLGYPRSQFVLAYNGISWPAHYAAAAHDKTYPDPYYLVIGSLEPRKNLRVVFQALEKDRQLLESHRFIFVGGKAVHGPQGDVPIPHSLQPSVEQGRIIFTGYLSDLDKYKLLWGAEATIYPSYFEGFGLPILESLSVGTPCIASYSSSIPEIGGNACSYFDPFADDELQSLLHDFRRRRPKLVPGVADKCRARARAFTWQRSVASILQALRPIVLAKTGGSLG